MKPISTREGKCASIDRELRDWCGDRHNQAGFFKRMARRIRRQELKRRLRREGE